MTITHKNELHEQEHITVRQLYETTKLFANTYEIAMQTDSDCGSDEHLVSVIFNASDTSEVETMLAVYGDFLVDYLDPGDKSYDEESFAKSNFIVFLLMTPVIWGKPIKKQ